MARIKQIELSEVERAELKRGYREGKTHSYRRRCQMILLKSEKRSSEDVAAILECCEPIVNKWLKFHMSYQLLFKFNKIVFVF